MSSDLDGDNVTCLSDIHGEKVRSLSLEIGERAKLTARSPCAISFCAITPYQLVEIKGVQILWSPRSVQVRDSTVYEE